VCRNMYEYSKCYFRTDVRTKLIVVEVQDIVVVSQNSGVTHAGQQWQEKHELHVDSTSHGPDERLLHVRHNIIVCIF